MRPVRKSEIRLDDLSWLTMPEKGWKEFRFLPAQKAFLETFENLVFDQYAPHCQRYRRFSQFKVVASHDSWALSELPHRPFIQSARYNEFSGGILRHFEPLQCDIAPYINDVFSSLTINTSRTYHLDVHQYRVCATPQANGISVPEGCHRDGQQCVAILVFRRHLITGAEMSLCDPATGQALYKTVLGENTGIVLDDEKILHDASPIAATGSEPGYRDYVVLNINEWEKRRYGEEFEHRAMAEPQNPFGNNS